MKLYLIYKFGDLFPMIVTLLERLTKNKYSYSNKSVLISALLFRSRNPRRLFRNVHHSRIRSRACCSIREGGRATEFLSLVKIFRLLGFTWKLSSSLPLWRWSTVTRWSGDLSLVGIHYRVALCLCSFNYWRQELFPNLLPRVDLVTKK